MDCKLSTSHLGRGLPLVGGGGFMVWARNCSQCRKMTRSCHDIVMWANVHPFYRYTIATSRITNIAHIVNTLSTDNALTIE
jgi:hypothetical protein